MTLILIVAMFLLIAALAPIFGVDSRQLHDPVDAEAPRPGLW